LRRVHTTPDDERLALHPALLDMATGFGLGLAGRHVEGEGVYVPISYGALRLYGPLPVTFHSHLRLTDESEGGTFARFEVVLTDEHGRVLLEVEGLTFKRVAPGGFTVPPRAGQAEPARTPLDHLVAAGIREGEGGQALARLLAAGAVGAIVVAPVPVREASALLRRGLPHAEEPVPSAADADLPNDPYEAFLVTEWRDLLGVGTVSVDANFFHLGGHSLLAVRLFRRIAKAHGCDLNLVTLFEVPTIRQLAERIRTAAASVEAGSTPVAVEERRIPRRSRQR
jgi:aryl carrier-like protein